MSTANRPQVLPGARADEHVDTRVAAVLEVLGGSPLAEVARRSAVDSALLHRWVRDFVEAGTAQVTNTPVEGAAQQRDRFLAAFAHEVRTPLAVAQGWVSMLMDGDLPPEAVESTAARLHAALSRLAERTLDVELLAAASLGRLRLSPQRVPVGELVTALPGLDGVSGEGPAVLPRPRPHRCTRRHGGGGSGRGGRRALGSSSPWSPRDDARSGSRWRTGALMTFRLACGDVMPGCSARFESTDRDRLMSQIGAHAAEEHGITTITPDILRAVQSKIIVST